MEFPHLKDTNFPIIDNVNVYKYQNNFDYARWQGKVSFKLLNVLWNSNYADVPYFDDVESRDEWFDSKEGYVGTLESLFNNTPENTVKIPIPYNDAYNYNYLVVDMPMQTSIDNPINYEDSSIRVKRWFYFIEDMVQFSPNTTELQLSVDYWTTFIHSVEIPYLMLERGHAPMTKTTVEQFLANPIANNEYLLADDFDYGTDNIIQTSNYMPIGNGTKYVLFCAPYAQSDFANFGGVTYSGNSTPPTFSDTSERWGYQIQVNGYEWKYGHADYSNANLPISNQIQDGVLNNCKCYAIEGSQAQSFFNDCIQNCVNFIHGIQAIFILDESLFTKGSGFTFRGNTIYPVSNKHIETNISLTKAMFGFDSKYADITKLYTFPYSQLELTDDEGNSFTAKVENCGSLKMHTDVSLIYPFLNYNVFFSGVNGDGTMNYTWKNINGTNVSKTMWASDFSKFMMNWNIPTYSLFVSSEYEYASNNFAGVQARRMGAIVEYENSVRFGNTTRENTADSFATSTANVNRSTSTMVTNVAADMQTLVDNTDTACDAAVDMRIERSSRQENIVGYNNQKIDNDAAISNSVTIQTAGLQNDLAALTYGNSSGASLNSAMLGAFGSMITGGIGGGGEIPGFGAVTGGISGIVSVGQTGFNIQAAGANLLAGVSNNLAVANLAQDATNAYALEATTCNNGVLHEGQYMDANVLDISNDSVTEQNTRTAITNKADAGRNKATQDANAAATQNTETNNATWNRNANVVAEQNNLIQKQREAEAMYRNARLQKPTNYGNYGGDFTNDVYQRRGVRLNIRTQTKSAIAQAGDAMLRFGYALHRVWDMSNGFHYCNEFTFWKAEDIWINDGSGVANVATNSIGNILMKGVTVWRNPDHIGTVGIYDNF